MVKFIPFLFILYAKFLINLKQPEYLLHLFDDDASFFVIKFPTFPSNITLLVFRFFICQLDAYLFFIPKTS